MGNSGKWSEDVTVREIPKTGLVAIGWLVFLFVTAGVIAWELQMRSIGLVAGDLDDSKAHWAVERRKIAAGKFDDVVIIGSSRILFDTNLDIWKEVTGRRPIQLALAGTNPRPFLKDFADNTDRQRMPLAIEDIDLGIADRPADGLRAIGGPTCPCRISRAFGGSVKIVDFADFSRLVDPPHQIRAQWLPGKINHPHRRRDGFESQQFIDRRGHGV